MDDVRHPRKAARQMKNGKNKLPPTAAFLFIGIAFVAIGISGNTPFVAIGCAFIAIGVAAIARHRRNAPGAPPDGETKDQ
jgi:hypothetical protein